jgi:F-type H+-transporting ATPase subunit b
MRANIISGFLLSMVLFVPAQVSFAEDKTPGEHPKKEQSINEKAGITRTDLGLYTLVVFGLLYFILRTKAWGPIVKLLDERENNIKQAYLDAEQARKDAQQYLEEIKAQKAKNADEVRAMIEEARRDAQALKDKLKADAASEVQADRERLRKEIETARDQALQELWNQTVQLAALVSSKAVRRDLTPDDHRRLVDEALAELKQNLTRA